MESPAQLEYDLLNRQQWIEAEVSRYLAARGSAASPRPETPALPAQNDAPIVGSLESPRLIPSAQADYAVSGISA